MTSARDRLTPGAAAVLGVVLVYFDTLHAGLWWDDYLFLRPYTPTDVLRAFHGTWDPTGTLPVFYRPLTIAYQAAVFHLLGFNLPAIHAVSVAWIAAIAWLLGIFAQRETRSRFVGCAAALVYAVHPAVARSQGPWFFLQYHSLCSMVAVCALLTWQSRRHIGGVRGWLPIFALATIGFLVRESLIVLVVAIGAAQVLRARMTMDVRAPAPQFWIAAAAHAAALIAARQWLLGTLGGPPVPNGLEWLVNAIRGPARTLAAFQPLSWPANMVATLAALACIAAGAWTFTSRACAPHRYLFAAGGVLLVAFNTPLLLASSSTRLYLLAIGSTLLLAAGVEALVRGSSRSHGGRSDGPLVRWRQYVVLAAVALSFTAASRAAIAPQRPCSSENLEADADVQSWDAVPYGLRAWLERKTASCRQTGRAPDLSTSFTSVVWPSRAGVVVGINGRSDGALLRVRAAGAGAAPTVVRYTIDNNFQKTEMLTTEWRTVHVPLPDGWRSRLRRLHLVEIALADSTAPGHVEVDAISPQAIGR